MKIHFFYSDSFEGHNIPTNTSSLSYFLKQCKNHITGSGKINHLIFFCKQILNSCNSTQKNKIKKNVKKLLIFVICFSIYRLRKAEQISKLKWDLKSFSCFELWLTVRMFSVQWTGARLLILLKKKKKKRLNTFKSWQPPAV